MSTYIITATPPTPNGDLHVGHLSGPYLGGDVLARYLRMRRNTVAYLCSSDDHQSYVVTTAARNGVEPERLADSSTDLIKSTLRSAGIKLDGFTRAYENPRHKMAVQEFVLALHQRGLIEAATLDTLYCPQCSRFLFESLVKGNCPFCGEQAAGQLCEACGRVNDPVRLHDARCVSCNSRPIVQPLRSLFFPLERFRNALKQHYESRTSWRPHLRALCMALVAEPLPPYPVSYPSTWGIPVPIAGFDDQVINVWLEMYPGHIATTETWVLGQDNRKSAGQLWAGDATIVQFLGYDNSFFNAVLHSALALAASGLAGLPGHIITNEFYLLDGQKFSTSRGHAIWGSDILKRIAPDALRFHMCRTNPESYQTDFSERDLSGTFLMLDAWGSFVNEFIHYVNTDFGGQLQLEQPCELQAQGLLGWARSKLERYYDVDEFSLRSASSLLQTYLDGCSAYLKHCVKPARDTSAEQYVDRLRGLGYLVRGLAILASPLMPGFSQRLWVTLGFNSEVAALDWEELDRDSRIVLAAGEQSWFRRYHDAQLMAAAAVGDL